MEAFAIANQHRIPLAPVRDVDEVMQDRNMHERGMLEWIEHDEIGRIVVPTTPLRIHGADLVDTVPSPKLGQHNREIYGDWLGLSAVEIAALEQDGVILAGPTTVNRFVGEGLSANSKFAIFGSAT